MAQSLSTNSWPATATCSVAMERTKKSHAIVAKALKEQEKDSQRNNTTSDGEGDDTPSWRKRRRSRYSSSGSDGSDSDDVSRRKASETGAAGAVGVGRRSEVEAAAAATAAATVAVALVVPTRSTNAVAKGAVGGIEIPLRSQLILLLNQTCGVDSIACMHQLACCR